MSQSDQWNEGPPQEPDWENRGASQQYGPQGQERQPQNQQAPPPHWNPGKRPRKDTLLMVAAVAVVVIVLLSAVMVVLMQPSGNDDEEEVTHNVVAKTIPVSADYTTAANEMIGSDGEVITGDTALAGLEIDIPAGAASEYINMRVNYAPVQNKGVKGLPNGAFIVSKMISIETLGSAEWNKFKMFDSVIKVTLPYDETLVQDDERTIRFYQYDEALHTLEPCGFAGQDLTANTITFYASTFSKFVAIEVVMSEFESLSASDTVDSGFRPANDGFYIPSTGSYLASGGYSLGMASFAKWYYTFEKDSTGTGLYTKYRQGEKNDWTDDQVAVELASRSQAGLQSVWSSLSANEQINISSEAVGISIIHGLMVSGEPQLVGLKTQYNDGTWATGSQAVLVYRYANNRFDVYDPNDPGTSAGTDTQQIPFTLSSGFERIYVSNPEVGSPLKFNVFYHASAALCAKNGAFSGLYDMAEKGFEDSSAISQVSLTDSETDVIGTTPLDTDDDGLRDTSENKMAISGTISGGTAVNSTLIFVNGQRYETNVEDGMFSKEVPLTPGGNDVVILATDASTFANWSGFLKTTIVSTASVAALTMTMSWDQDNSDVDLHVLELAANETEGRHIYYGYQGDKDPDADPLTPYLDFDNTEGYGPEHYYAAEDAQLPLRSVPGTYGDLYGTYQIRVQYYEDKDSDAEATQPITWHLHIRYLQYRDLSTGTEFWGDMYYTGYLTSARTSVSTNFDSTDPSWSSLYVFEYQEPVPSNYGIPIAPQNAYAW